MVENILENNQKQLKSLCLYKPDYIVSLGHKHGLEFKDMLSFSIQRIN